MNASACDICCNEYDFNNYRPVVGSCGHSLCLNCSRRILGICPKCREHSFDTPRTNFGMLELIENRRIEKERLEKEHGDLLRAVQETVSDMAQENILMKLNLERKTNTEGCDEDRAGFPPSPPSRTTSRTERSEAFSGPKKQKFLSSLFKNVEENKETLQTMESYYKNLVNPELFIRALSNSQVPSENELALEFKFGDILQITHKSNKEYWVARQVLPDGTRLPAGLIYSKKCQEAAIKNSQSDSKEPILSYQVVKAISRRFPRPIVVLGALKKTVANSLVETRPNLLDRIARLSPHDIRKMHKERMYPIVIFIGPENLQSIRSWNSETSEIELKRVQDLVKESSIFTARIDGSLPSSEIISIALMHIDRESQPIYFIPRKNQSAIHSFSDAINF